jgi:hypothetical protein
MPSNHLAYFSFILLFRITLARQRYCTDSRLVQTILPLSLACIFFILYFFNNVPLLQIGEVVTTIPTIGFNVESVTYKNLNFNVWV